MNEITLKCFNCGKEQNVLVESLPMFSFELVDIASTYGMLGVFDFTNSRSLVFCNKTCCNASKKKRGTFKKR